MLAPAFMSKSVVPAFRVRLLLNNNPPKLPLKATVSAAVSTLTKSVVRLLTTNFSADGKPWITVDGPSNLLTKESVSTVNMESPLSSFTANFSDLATPSRINCSSCTSPSETQTADVGEVAFKT
eukprot:Lithocolla_globosa_v1_NODE_345_length_4393_cov_6.676349.p5 type:complete len:124 gc:universal NODE_345_length_4393_cov_6.676349:3876-4247(+)